MHVLGWYAYKIFCHSFLQKDGLYLIYFVNALLNHNYTPKTTSTMRYVIFKCYSMMRICILIPVLILILCPVHCSIYTVFAHLSEAILEVSFNRRHPSALNLGVFLGVIIWSGGAFLWTHKAYQYYS